MVLTALPQDTVRLIKSTQVITTPSSIVKELVENSLDASATTVSVKLEKFGFIRLEVRDNGSGINENDVECLAKPHYTSKISSFADLSSLSSYGFRGEALSSLCAVADVTVTTKRKEDGVGHSYTFNHRGEVTSKRPAPTPNGTTVVVTNLFKNVPVRYQYYTNTKHCKDELKKVENTLLGLAVASPSLHVSLSHDRATIFQKNSAANIQGVVLNLFPEIYKGFSSKQKVNGDVILDVFLPQKKFCGIGDYGRSSADRLFTLVNKRPVTHKSIEKIIKAYFNLGYETCHGRYPVGFVSLTMPAESIDVNLEPNKTKVLLKDEDVVLAMVREILEDFYGPLEKADKSKNKTPSDHGDITCTFAGVTQVSPTAKVPGTNNKNETFCEDDSFLVDNFQSKKTEQNNVVTVGSTACKKFDSQTQRNILSLKTSVLEPQREVRILDVSVAPRVISGRDKDENPLKRTMEREVEISLMKNFGNDDGEQKRCRMASTPENRMLEVCPNLSLSTIHSSGDSHCVDKPQNSNTSSSETVQSHMYGLGTASKDSHQSFANTTTALSPPHDKCEEDEREIIDCDKDSRTTVSNAENKNLKQNGKEVFDETLNASLCDNRNDLAHISTVGSDGIPVYKIAPLSQNIIDDVDMRGKNKSHNTELQSKSRNVDEDKENMESMKEILNEFSNENNCTNSNVNQNKENIETRKEIQSEFRTENEMNKDIVKPGNWSRGIPVNGCNIQTVQLLKPPNSNSCVGESSIQKLEGKRPLSLVSPDVTSAPPKKKQINSLASTSFEYIHNKPVRRPTSSFIYFSRDIRPHVLAENPGKDFAFVAREMANRWKELTGETKKLYEDMAKEDSERYQREIRKIREARGLNDSADTSLKAGLGSRATLDRYVAPLTPQLIKKRGKTFPQQPLVSKHPWKDRCKEIDITVNMIKQRMESQNKLASIEDSPRLIGSLANGEGWICLKDGEINTLNVARLHETILCRSLFQTFTLPAPSVIDPIPFNSSVIGEDNWTTLCGLKREKVFGQNFYTVTDKRVTKNGFKIALYRSYANEAEMSHGEIVGVADNLGFYGISDLKEILSILVINQAATIGQTRPLKLQFWLKGEAVRMVRTGFRDLCAEDIKEKLRTWKDIRSNISDHTRDIWDQGKCLHDKPIFTALHSLDDLPFSQSKSQS
ncbi:PMS1 protein homolog 1-like [Macrobrachium nipponense]|uniref:PMS1 protein homolog 1-like n=1 Tax=Macrobrachium nipponense TaxID=159736 RepID=UPI0030C7EB24